MNRLKKDDLIQSQSKSPSQANDKSQQENGEKLNGKNVHTDKGVKVKEGKEKKGKIAKDDSLLPKKKASRKKGLTQ